MAYIRDGRAPVPRNERISATMSRIRAKNTKPERVLRSMLREAGKCGYRLHYSKVPGRPDITFVKHKLAIFVHGCFWHGCPYCRPRTPKSNSTFWTNKVAMNQARDRRKNTALRELGWTVLVIRECQLRERPQAQLARVLKVLGTET